MDGRRANNQFARAQILALGCVAVRPNAHIIIGKISFQDRRVPLNDSPPYLLFQSDDGFLSPAASLLLLRPSGTAQRLRKDETTNPNPIHRNLHFVFWKQTTLVPAFRHVKFRATLCTAFW